MKLYLTSAKDQMRLYIPLATISLMLSPAINSLAVTQKKPLKLYSYSIQCDTMKPETGLDKPHLHMQASLPSVNPQV